MSIPERWKGHPPLPRDLGDRLERVVERLRRGSAQLVYLFGSAAGRSSAPAPADPREPADLDLAVWGLEEDRWAVLADLASILDTDRIELAILREYQDMVPFRDTQMRYVRERHGD